MPRFMLDYEQPTKTNFKQPIFTPNYRTIYFLSYIKKLR